MGFGAPSAHPPGESTSRTPRDRSSNMTRPRIPPPIGSPPRPPTARQPVFCCRDGERTVIQPPERNSVPCSRATETIGRASRATTSRHLSSVHAGDEHPRRRGLRCAGTHEGPRLPSPPPEPHARSADRAWNREAIAHSRRAPRCRPFLHDAVDGRVTPRYRSPRASGSEPPRLPRESAYPAGHPTSRGCDRRRPPDHLLPEPAITSEDMSRVTWRSSSRASTPALLRLRRFQRP
jgi:hypothetical protein